jgi:excisionase family DNA binding protein
MFEAEALEFPWVETLPKREKSKAVAATELVNEFIALQKKHGALLPATMVAVALNLSKARVYQFIEEGRLKAVMFRGVHYIGEDDLRKFAKEERKAGRPCKARNVTFAECLQIGKDIVKAAKK